ncbi:Polyadenylate-binding protein RBP47A (Poly(A)-binding protein RBP47A) (RNA-binding protein 47A) (AtRBP47A) [Durusdinium trenchii]|uniref:Polyadenylate-binding protein RBP47A (Poly(A)-binding protein RBP47A) (RNA-binding protein 47A) (AtRBP47A) n=1 Tax=Durusdinium trenchii TaxID=1381693 RepID=A0ABP0J787_9DINO
MMGEKGAMSEVEIPIHDPHIPVSVDPAQSVVGTSSSSSLLYPDGAGIHSVSGFAFVEFADRAPVADAVDRLEGRAFHALGFNFRVNWAQFSVNDSNLANRNGSGASRGTEYSIYVGGLDFAVKDHDLLNAFMSRYPSAFQAKVICDQRTQFSRGFGFVRFREQREAEEAIREMQGVFIGSKAIKVKQANRSQEPHRDSTPWTVAPPPCPMVPVIDSMAVTTVLCISQLDAATPQDLQQLLQRCAAFGAVLRHVFVEASCFVEFQESTAAEAAASHLAGECGLSVHFSDSATVEYYRSLQLEDGTTRRDGDWPRGE